MLIFFVYMCVYGVCANRRLKEHNQSPFLSKSHSQQANGCAEKAWNIQMWPRGRRSNSWTWSLQALTRWGIWCEIILPGSVHLETGPSTFILLGTIWTHMAHMTMYSSCDWYKWLHEFCDISWLHVTVTSAHHMHHLWKVESFESPRGRGVASRHTRAARSGWCGRPIPGTRPPQSHPVPSNAPVRFYLAAAWPFPDLPSPCQSGCTSESGPDLQTENDVLRCFDSAGLQGL